MIDPAFDKPSVWDWFISSSHAVLGAGPVGPDLSLRMTTVSQASSDHSKMAINGQAMAQIVEYSS